MDTHSYAHLIFHGSTQKIQWRKDKPLQQMFLGKLDICMQKTEEIHFFHPI
jgi:hypothetical protein